VSPVRTKPEPYAGLTCGKQKEAKRSSNQEAIETLRLSEKQWDEVVAVIKSGQVSHVKSASRRRYARSTSLGLIPVVIEIEQPGGTVNTIISRGYDISSGGLGMVHGRFLHPGSKVVCWLRHASKAVVPVTGTIRWCKHVTGMAHMSGVQFDRTINEYEHMPSSLIAG